MLLKEHRTIRHNNLGVRAKFLLFFAQNKIIFFCNFLWIWYVLSKIYNLTRRFKIILLFFSLNIKCAFKKKILYKNVFINFCKIQQCHTYFCVQFYSVSHNQLNKINKMFSSSHHRFKSTKPIKKVILLWRSCHMSFIQVQLIINVFHFG